MSENELSENETAVESESAVQHSRESLTAPGIRHLVPGSAQFVTVDPARIDPHLVTLYDSDPQASQQYRRLVVSLVSLASSRPAKRILVTSAKHGEGRTSVVLNLAGALAQAKRRVLVIDSDLSRPSMLRMLGINVKAGLPEGIASGLPLEDTVVKILPFGFSLLATRSNFENTVEVLSSLALRADLQFFESEYDFILFDSPPLLDSPDAQMMLNLVDTSLLVIRPGVTTPDEMSQAVGIFRKEDLIGVVLNRNPESTPDE